jgi:hypothetical protein
MEIPVPARASAQDKENAYINYKDDEKFYI